MKIRRTGKRDTRQKLKAHARPWVGTTGLHSVHRLNETCLRILRDGTGPEGRLGELAIGKDLSELWLQLDDQARLRASKTPVILVDLNFQTIEWWRWTQSGGPRPPRIDKPANYFPDEHAFLNELLLEAWNVVRTAPRAARILYGMSPHVEAHIATLSSSDITRIATRHLEDLRPRWEEKISFWRNLLIAAINDDSQALSDTQLHTLQLLGSEFLPST